MKVILKIGKASYIGIFEESLDPQRIQMAAIWIDVMSNGNVLLCKGVVTIEDRNLFIIYAEIIYLKLTFWLLK